MPELPAPRAQAARPGVIREHPDRHDRDHPNPGDQYKQIPDERANDSALGNATLS